MVTAYPAFVLLCTLGLSSAIPSSRVLGAEACTHGPSYWCKDLATAVECDAVKHCTQTVWNSPVTADGACDLCQEVFEVVQDFVTSNKTESIVRQYLFQMCRMLPGKGLSAQCDDLVKTYLPLIMNMLKEQLTPSQLCQMGGFCSRASGAVPMMSLTAAKPAGIPLVPLVKQGGPTCEICKLVIQQLESMLANNATEDEIKKALLAVCGYLPEAYLQECDALVDEYEDMLIQLLLQSLDPNYVCSELGLCPSAKKHPLVGAVQCTWGPSFWCLSHENAKQCDAEDFCKRHKWV
uniref:Pulmonary surfactant-associated protein B n=1 Tax=Eptatretus burgeri TaxID=7764 RepID=A0A8C4NA25_EPTBU